MNSENEKLLDDIEVSIPNYITKIDLINKMVTSENFNFIKILDDADVDSFIEEYLIDLNDKEEQLKYYDSGVIKISTCLSIMKKINVKNHYVIYRNAYSGENIGVEVINQIKDESNKCMLIEFGSEKIKTIDLLIDNRNISRIYFFRRSNFINLKVFFWDKIMR